MPSSYTLNNGIELIGTGEQSGTWGDTTNTNLELLDTALDGQVTITAASAGSSGSPNSLPISDGSASNGRNRLVNITSGTNLGSTVYYQLTPNDAEKIIYIRNSLNTQDLIVFQGTYNSSNDYVIPNGTTAVIFFNGAGSGAVAANVMSNAHFDALNIVGNAVVGGDLTVDTDTLYVDSTNNRVGIGTTSPASIIHSLHPTSPTLTLERDSTSLANNNVIGEIAMAHKDSNDAGTAVRIIGRAEGTAGAAGLAFNTGTPTSISEAMRIDSSQRVLINTNTSRVVGGSAQAVTQIYNTSNGALLSLFRDQASNNGGAIIRGGKARNGAIVQDNDTIFSLEAVAHDGTDMGSFAGTVAFLVDGTPGANDTPSRIAFYTTADGAASGTERMRINSSGHVTIGSGGSQTNNLTVYDSAADSAITIQSADASTAGLVFGDATDFSRGRIVYDNDDESMAFETNNLSEAMRIDSSQRVLIGGITSNTVSGYANSLQLQGTLADDAGASITRYANSSAGGVLTFGKTRSATVGTVGTVVQDGDALGYIMFAGDDGTDIVTNAAWVIAEVDGTPGSNDMPGRLIFSTTADGAASPTERMRINNAGYVNIGSGSDPDALLRLNASTPVLKIRDTRSKTWVAGETLSSIDFDSADASNTPDTVAKINVETDDGSVGTYTAMTFSTATPSALSEAMRIDSSQRVMVGTATNIPITNASLQFEVVGDTNDSGAGGVGIARFGGGSTLALGGSPRSTTTGSFVVVQNNDNLGNIFFSGDDGTDLRSVAARISADVDGTPGANDMPGRLEFYTTSDGASSATERLRIDSGGNATFKTGGMNIKFPYNSTTDYSGNLGWQHVQFGNNGANRIVAGNTTTGGDFEFIVNNTVDLSTNNSISHNGLLAMIITSGGLVEMHTPNSAVGLYINNTNHDSIVQIQASAANKNSVIRFADGDDADVGMIDYDHSDNTMDITTNALTNGLEISGTKGRHSWKTFENWDSSNYNMSIAPGTVFQRKGTIADDVKIRVFQGSYTYSGGSIEFVIRKDAGTQTSVGSGVIYFNGREAENNHVIVGYNDSSQIVTTADPYSTQGADGKFTFSIRGTSGDSHLSIENRLGSEVNLALKFNILYTG